MSSPESHPLQLLLDQACAERDAARDGLSRATTAWTQSQQQLAQLEGFARDYEVRWQTQFKGGAAVEVLRCYQDFIRRLNQAIEQQRHAMAAAQVATERERARLLARETRVVSVRSLMDKRSDRARTQAARRDQKQTDELAARARAISGRHTALFI